MLQSMLKFAATTAVHEVKEHVDYQMQLNNNLRWLT